MPDVTHVSALPAQVSQQADLASVNQQLEKLTAAQRVEWALANLPGPVVLSSSFGIQAAVMLHMITSRQPDIPVVLTDTGYLFAETYQFIDDLTEQLGLNLHVYRSEISPAWQEVRYGKLWEQGVQGLEQYNRLNKIEPMNKAMAELGAQSWFAGLRRSQSDTRQGLPVLQYTKGQFKLMPIVDWNNKQVHYYLQEHRLPYHPLWERGYVSVGDWHTSVPLEAGMSEQDTRFFGLKRECGLHEFGDGI